MLHQRPRRLPGGNAVNASRLMRRLGVLVALTVVYVVAGKFGLRLAFVHASVTAVWAPTGISLAAFLVNMTTAGSVATSIGIAVGNTVEGLVGAYLVTRFAGGRRAFLRAPDALRFALLAAILAPAISATLGVTTLSVGGFAPWRNF